MFHSFCLPFYKDVSLKPLNEDGFGLKELQLPRSQAEIVALTWPCFDKEVALGKRHMHRMPFSVHEKSSRVAIPFESLDDMPTCVEDMPRVDDTMLGEKLRRPVRALQNVVERLKTSDLLATTTLSSEIKAMATAAVASTQKTKKRKCYDTTSSLTPLKIDLESVSTWQAALVAKAASTTKHHPSDDDDMVSFLKKLAVNEPEEKGKGKGKGKDKGKGKSADGKGKGKEKDDGGKGKDKGKAAKGKESGKETDNPRAKAKAKSMDSGSKWVVKA